MVLLCLKNEFSKYNLCACTSCSCFLVLVARVLVLLSCMQLSQDARDETPIRQLTIRKLPTVSTRKPLYEILNLFQSTTMH